MENKMPSNAHLNMNFYDESAKTQIMPNDSQYGFLYERNKNYMNNVALTFDNKVITYEQLHDHIDEYARTLYKKGVRETDIVAICTANTPEAIYLDYAINKLGAISVPISPLSNEYKMKQDLEIIKPKMFVGIEDSYGTFRKASEGMAIEKLSYPAVASMDSKLIKTLYGVQQIVKKNRTFSTDDKLLSAVNKYKDYSAAVFPKYKEGSESHIIFTGGSSGTHKGVVLDNNGLNCVVKDLDYVLPLEPGDKFMGNLPQFMAFGKMAMHYALCKSLQVDLTLKAMPADFKDELYRLKPQGVFAGPVQWEHFINRVFTEITEGDSKIDFSLSNTKDYKEYLQELKEILEKSDKEKYDMSWLKVGVSGGEQLKMLTEKLASMTLKEFGAADEIYNGLGMTEMWAPVSVKTGSKCSEGTIGPMMPSANQMIVDPQTLEEKGFDEVGLLLVNGPGMMHGYYNNPEETAKVLIDINGVRWLNSGDMAKVLPTGELVYVDRLKRSFVCGVENVYPQQIENMLSEIPEIKEAIVTKVADNELQFVPKYHISLREDCDIEKLKVKIDNLIGKTLGESYIPRYHEFYNTNLPRTANGKLDPKPLQAEDDEMYSSKIRTL